MSILIYLGDRVLLTLMEFLGSVCLKVTVNIGKRQGKGRLGEQGPTISVPIVSPSACLPSPRAYRGSPGVPLRSCLGEEDVTALREGRLGSEEPKEAPLQLPCQVKWRGEDLNSNLFTLDHVLLALTSVCAHIAWGKSVCI